MEQKPKGSLLWASAADTTWHCQKGSTEDSSCSRKRKTQSEEMPTLDLLLGDVKKWPEILRTKGKLGTTDEHSQEWARGMLLGQGR